MAIKIFHMVGAPTLQNLKIIISQSIIQNFPVTFEYIDIAQKIFCPGVSSFKVIETIQRPKVVV